MARRVGNWELEPVPIGSGSFAIVWKARHLESGVLGAVKEISTEKLSPKLHESLQSEIAVLRQTRHRNIVGMLDLIEEPGKMFLVLEFCSGGDLGQYLRQYRCVSEHAARYLMLQLSAGLAELHKLNVLHRDLKPQNLLLSDTSQQPTLKIADFGFARNLHPQGVAETLCGSPLPAALPPRAGYGSDAVRLPLPSPPAPASLHVQGMAETLCGSPLYMAPEILQSHKYDTKADLWSVGTILHEMLTGRPPFTGTNHIQLLHNIQRLEPRLSESLPHHLSPPCRQLLLQLLRHEPQQRIGFEDFFLHPFLQQQQGEGAGGEASMAPSPHQQRQQQQQQGGERQSSQALRHHDGHQQTWRAEHRSPQEDAAVPGTQRQGNPVGLSGPLPAPCSPPRQQQHPAGRPWIKAQHPLEPGHSDSDCEYVVVSGSSSPLAASETGAGPAAPRRPPLPTSASVHHPSTSAPAGRAQRHARHRHGGGGAGPAIASMATAWAAAAAQAMASVARSVQQPHGLGLSPPSGAAKHRQQRTPEASKGMFYYPQTSSQLPPTAEPRSTGSGSRDHTAQGHAERASVSLPPAAPVAAGRVSRSGSSVSQREAGQGGSQASGSGASSERQQQRPGGAEPAAAAERQREREVGGAGAAAAAAPPSQLGVDLGLLAHQIRLPAHLDPGDLLQRVILLLTESVRGRIAAAEAAELAEEEAGEGGGGEGEEGERRRRAQAAAGALPGQLLALYLYSGRLLEAGLAAALGAASAACPAAGGGPVVSSLHASGVPAAADADACLIGSRGGCMDGSLGGEVADDATAGEVGMGEAAAKAGCVAGARQGDEGGNGGLHRPSPAPDLRLLLPLKRLGKTLLACLEGRPLQELRRQVARPGTSGGGAGVPAAAQVVLDSALRFGRAAAADELLGLLPLGVEGYARAADLLLFLLTELALPAGAAAAAGPGPAPLLPEELRPRLGAEERQRVYTVYAAVKLRQVSCMAALNAQLRGA